MRLWIGRRHRSFPEIVPVPKAASEAVVAAARQLAEDCMNEPIEETLPVTEFSDDLSDEALDREENVPYCQSISKRLRRDRAFALAAARRATPRRPARVAPG